MLKQLIEHKKFSAFDLSSLENLSYGGAPTPFPVIRKAIEMFPQTMGFVNAFGQTETTSTLTVLGPEDHRLDGTPAKDDLIIRGGENIAPAEVEAVLHAHPAVDEAAVIGMPDEEWGQKVVAFVVLRPNNSTSSEELSAFCRQRLASFKKPEIIRFVEELPKNPLGKVLRKELRA